MPVGSASAIDSASDKLNNYALLLAKVHGWLELANNPSDASSDAYYSLALIPSSGDNPLTADETTHQGDELKMALTSTDRVVAAALGLCARHRLSRSRNGSLPRQLHRK